ncbi:MAG: riboflavin biosynthesis protein RibD, partial [Proteobacteria bacterium]|nr:riboflavin biosynthesis protein RibD [Pseudomonadota bacterium]
MNRALVLARQGFGYVHPNPMVGAIVLDSNGEMVGQGYHEKYG